MAKFVDDRELTVRSVSDVADENNNLVEQIGDLFCATLDEDTRTAVALVAHVEGRHPGRQMAYVLEQWVKTLPMHTQCTGNIPT